MTMSVQELRAYEKRTRVEEAKAKSLLRIADTLEKMYEQNKPVLVVPEHLLGKEEGTDEEEKELCGATRAAGWGSMGAKCSFEKHGLDKPHSWVVN